jgi:PTH1 family peptidyl-tRNA hydrolase
MMLVAGLGNPGKEYAGTRHNLGFMAVDKIAAEHGFPEWREKPKYLFTKKKIGSADIILAKPATFMNLSGEALLSLSALYKIPPGDMVVIHDDLDLPPGRIRTKLGGGTAGHNGLKSIDGRLGPGYHRIRVGIGHPRDAGQPMDAADYVLSKIPPGDMEKIAAAIAGISSAFEAVIAKDFAAIPAAFPV